MAVKLTAGFWHTRKRKRVSVEVQTLQVLRLILKMRDTNPALVATIEWKGMEFLSSGGDLRPASTSFLRTGVRQPDFVGFIILHNVT